MKKLLLISLFVLAAFVPIFAVTGNDSILISGTVAPTVTVALSADKTDLTLTGTSSTTVTIGTATVTTNSKNWTIGVSSANASILKASGTTDQVIYTFTLKDDTPAVVSGFNGISLTTSATTSSPFTQKVASAVFSMEVTYTGASDLNPGTYEDTITVTVTAN